MDDGYHDYTITWNAATISWVVDGTTIRTVSTGDGVNDKMCDQLMSIRISDWYCIFSHWCGDWDVPDGVDELHMCVQRP
jgi:beta-glucanase (GH16 family)